MQPVAVGVIWHRRGPIATLGISKGQQPTVFTFLDVIYQKASTMVCPGNQMCHKGPITHTKHGRLSNSKVSNNQCTRVPGEPQPKGTTQQTVW